MNILFTHCQARKVFVAFAFALLFALPAAWSQSGYFVKFPDDILVDTCNPAGCCPNFPFPLIGGDTTGVLIGMSYEDQIFTDVPDACYRLERTWTIIDWFTYDPILPATIVPNPNPNSSIDHPANLPGPTVSAPGTSSPWAPTIVKITPSDPSPTNYSVYWSATANAYRYTQIILFRAPIMGTALLDTDLDCQSDASEVAMPDIMIKATDSEGTILYQSTGENGSYGFEGLAPGSVTLEAIPWVSLWTACNNPATVTLGTDHVNHDFNLQPTVLCPLMTVDVGTWLLRPCDTSNWVVSYCNLGGATGEDAEVVLDLDPAFSVVSVSLPGATISGSSVTVPIGDVPVGFCGTFNVELSTPCDPEIVGETYCVSAHIYPDSICLPPSAEWSGAQIEASAVCEGDSVRFTLRNTGVAPTAGPLDYVIIDDMVIMKEGQVPAGLASGASVVEVVYATSNTLRVSAKQEPGHPLTEEPSLGVDNCNGVTATSMLLNFRNADGDPFTTRECREVRASFDPNEKLAFPRGFTDEHYIEPNTPLQYQIGFQNTGNDTAFLVVLRDTLSTFLNPASIRMGASSHPYTWTLNGAGILTVKFANILLVDSTTNEKASHGFVQFDIEQQPDNAIGAVVENRAGIYFDINPVVLTNTVFHTIGVDFLETTSGATEAYSQRELLKVWPNPATSSAFLPLDGAVQVRLLDAYGRVVRTYAGQAPGLTLQRDGLADGIYFLEVRTANGQQRTGKLIWQNSARH